eukprot:TRINITY_DN2148_c0_g1_i1.p1 TRINITY_DN2148_c0_g1~~TRINITY_DN2148_c0_g1_i1.p1  ORF type:complete len:132 (-),score=36.96 TRINITY_DN2148_c0_g1_i1:39-434(-)
MQVVTVSSAFGAVARRSCMINASILCRAAKGGGDGKGKKGKGKHVERPPELTGLGQLKTINKRWNIKFIEKANELPPWLASLAIHIPTEDETIDYNPNDPKEIKQYLRAKRREQLRENNDDMHDSRGVPEK